MAPIIDLSFSYWLGVGTLSLLGLSCFALTVILYSRRTFSLAQERKKNDLRFRYQYFLYDALVESQAGNDAPDFQDIVLARFREEEKKHPLDKQLLTDLLINLKRNLTGSSEAQLLQLAEALQLPQYIYQKLQHRHWSVQAQGIHEMSNLHPSDDSFRSDIAELRTSDTLLLSQEAQLAIVKLSDPPDLSFLDNLHFPLSHWQQIHLFHHLRTIRKEAIPDFSQWLRSDNESVVLFSLRMIAEFEQRRATDLVLQQLTHPSKTIVLEAIRTSQHLQLTEAIEPLVTLLHHEEASVQLASLRAIGQLGSTHHLSCLHPFLTYDDYWVRRAAADAIAQLKQPQGSIASPTKSSLQPLD